MPTATDGNGHLDIQVHYNAEQYLAELKKFTRAAEDRAQVHQDKVQQILDQGEAKREVSEKLSAQKIENTNAQMWARYETQQKIAQDRIAKGHTAWSQQIARQLNTIALSLKALAVAYTLNAVKSSLAFTAALSDQAEALGISADQLLAYQSAARAAGATSEDIVKILTRLEALRTGGGDPKQTAALSRLGIDPTAAKDTVQLLDAIIQKYQSGKVTAADLADILSIRLTNAFRLVANEAGTSANVIGRYGNIVSDAWAKTADKLEDRWNLFWNNMKLGTVAFFTMNTREFDQFVARMTGLDNLFYRLYGGGGGARSLRTHSLEQFGPPAPSADEMRSQSAADAAAQRMREMGVNATSPFTVFSPEDLDRREAAYQAFLDKIASDAATTDKIMEDARERVNAANAAADERYAEAKRRKEEELARAVQMIWQEAQQTFYSFVQLQSVLSQNRIDQVQREIDAVNALSQADQERWSDQSTALREAGLEHSTLYRNEQRAFEANQRAHAKAAEELAKKQKQLQSRAFEQERTGRVAETLMSTGQAIMNALATVHPFVPLGLIMSAFAATQGAMQVAAIEAQQNPYRGMRTGGWVEGDERDQNYVRTSGGEFVTTREDARRNAEALEYMHRGGTVRPRGGDIVIQINGTVLGTQDWIDNELIPQLKRYVRRGGIIPENN